MAGPAFKPRDRQKSPVINQLAWLIKMPLSSPRYSSRRCPLPSIPEIGNDVKSIVLRREAIFNFVSDTLWLSFAARRFAKPASAGTPGRLTGPTSPPPGSACLLHFSSSAYFFLAFVVQSLWNTLKKDFTRLPRLSYFRACGFVTLWGLLFVVVLTMISGARELMTPGAWKRRATTYELAEPLAATTDDRVDGRKCGNDRNLAVDGL